MLTPLLSQDCSFWFSSGTFAGLTQARQAFEKTWSLIKNEVYEISDVRWLAGSDTTAVCVYTFRWEGLVNGERRVGTGRGTSVLRFENSQWKLVHEHLSAFPKV